MPTLFLATAALLYLGYVALRLGIHQRLALILTPISLDAIPDRAAAAYGDTPLFTTDEPCAWDVPALAQRYPDATAWSALRIRDTANAISNLLRHLGVAPGDRVAVMKRNHLDMHVFAAAIVRAGAIACPINNQFESSGIGEYLEHTGARTLITDVETVRRVLEQGGGLGSIRRIILADRRNAGFRAMDAAFVRAADCGIELHWIEEALASLAFSDVTVRRHPDDVMYLVHSSGTTGFPKAVMLKNGAQSHAVRGWLSYVHLSRTFDRGYLAVPNNHQAVMLTFHSTLLLGLPAHWTCAYARTGFDASRVISELADGRFTGYFGFPITYTQLKEVPLHRFDLRRMRFWATTADASHESIQRQFAAVGGAFRSVGIPFDGSVFLDAQGSSEVGTPSVLRYVTRFTTKFARRIGRPGSTPFGPAVRVASQTHDDAGEGVVGRLEVRGRTLFAGYWNDEALTRSVMWNGWFFTGDAARVAADGNIIQLDREVDVIHTAAGPVYSLPMEEIIHKHHAVFDVCAYGALQEDGLQVPAAAVAVRSGTAIDATRLRTELNELLHPAQQLQSVEIMPWAEFPIGVTGKTLKRVFRDRAAQAIRATAVPRLPAAVQFANVAHANEPQMEPMQPVQPVQPVQQMHPLTV